MYYIIVKEKPPFSTIEKVVSDSAGKPREFPNRNSLRNFVRNHGLMWDYWIADAIQIKTISRKLRINY